ncbi:hypothetical protein [Leifsonia sp. 22587]|uniref:hypothetical protein n=1 Tax=Leifsonia sp. 22587 TaxID=3453946 RepID=UPI003F87B81B
MNQRARAARVVSIVAATLLAAGLAGCTGEPNGGTTAAVTTGCLNLRSAVTNLEALRSWCVDHGDPAGAAAWMSGIENSLKAEVRADSSSAARADRVAGQLDEQIQLLAGADKEAAVAQLPDALARIIDELAPARDGACGVS